ncbi:MAG: hypothetical protein BWZ07_00502 [Alphaproteobacteria bacterium ADurb.BinA280]|jgi:hypothetical protein|nr:MAG: hypothetical protein BWZ07_00502 [Alphaproteobacteria bacterium ADurb.BinA280]
MQGKAAETTNLNTITGRQSGAHLFQNCLYGKIDILSLEVGLPTSQQFNEFRLGHGCLIIYETEIAKTIDAAQ